MSIYNYSAFCKTRPLSLICLDEPSLKKQFWNRRITGRIRMRISGRRRARKTRNLFEQSRYATQRACPQIYL